EGIPRTGRYSAEDDQRTRATIEGAGFVYAPAPVVPNSTRSLELAQLARERGRFGEVHHALFSAYWSEGRDIGDPETLVEIGATGDLASRKLLPALHRLAVRDRLGIPVVGVASSDWDDEELRRRARKAVEQRGEAIDEDGFRRFAAALSYVSGDYRDPGAFD